MPCMILKRSSVLTAVAGGMNGIGGCIGVGGGCGNGFCIGIGSGFCSTGVVCTGFGWAGFGVGGVDIVAEACAGCSETLSKNCSSVETVLSSKVLAPEDISSGLVDLESGSMSSTLMWSLAAAGSPW